MPYLDLRMMGKDNSLEADVCIVGAGVAGSVLAAELVKSNQKIILLESGGATANPDTQSLYDLEFTRLPFRKNFVSRVREYGGSCNTWTGRAMQFQAIDFTGQKNIPLHKWPITLADIKPFYAKAGTYLNLPDQQKFNLLFWSDKLSTDEKGFWNETNLAPTISLWSKQNTRFGFESKTQSRIKAAEKITTVVWANLTNLSLHKDLKTVATITANSINGNSLTLKAKRFVLACGGIENASILLNSNKQLPNGLGNQCDNVGRYFMDHPKFDQGIIKLLKPMTLNHMIGRPMLDGKVRLGLALDPVIQQKENLLNPHLTISPVFLNQDSKTSTILEEVSDDQSTEKINSSAKKIARYYLKNALRPSKVVNFKITNYLEQAPIAESRVYLSNQKNQLGQRKSVLNWQVDDRAFRSIERLHHYLKKYLTNHQIGVLEAPFDILNPPSLSDASHHMGTTRMSSQPADGVVDAACKVHGLTNLYIAGSSVFPTSGNANPTFTIIALAIRLAKHLNQQND
jgi:choline dehydrogenase-like flavoprotein